MTYEKENGISNSRPFVGLADSPKGYSTYMPLPKLAASSAASNSEAVKRISERVNGNGTEVMEEEVATPLKSFLNSNITPRSGSRKARVESASSTPNGNPKVTTNTPAPSKIVFPTEKLRRSGGETQAVSGLAIITPGCTTGRSSRAASVTSDGAGSSFAYRRPPVERRNSGPSAVRKPETPPMFFHADDVKTTKRSRPSSATGAPQAWMTGNADGRRENGPVGNAPTMSDIASSLDEQRPKLFYANEDNHSKIPCPRPTNGGPPQRPVLQTIYSEHDPAATMPLRPTSPLKEEVPPREQFVTKSSPSPSTCMHSGGNVELRSPDTIARSDSRLSRRSSLSSPASPQIRRCARSSSKPSYGRSTFRKLSLSTTESSPPEKDRTSPALSNHSIPSCSVKPSSAAQGQSSSPLHMQPQSPIKPQCKLDQMNELAANARRERKVLDLEISNSSLLAINRTLEREVRKQNTELRKYRRLSRSGRLSIGPSSRSASGKKVMHLMTDVGMESDDLLSVSDTEGNDEHENGLSDDSSSSTKSRPSSLTSRAARNRFQDPRILSLDLNAHRALLLQSQKLNQSIRRCLGHTESLITSGKRALEYKAHYSGVEKLGPRVLTPDEIEDNVIDRRQGLLSPSAFSFGITVNPWEFDLDCRARLDGGLEKPAFQEDLSAAGLQALDSGVQPVAELNIKARNIDKKMQGMALNDTNVKNSAYQNEFPVPTAEGEEGSIAKTLIEYEDSSKAPLTSAQSSSTDKVTSQEDKEIAGADTADSTANTPGNRSSMQNLGHYLQSLSIFGTGGFRPP